MGINGFTNEDMARMEADKDALLDEIRELRAFNDALRNAGDRVLKAQSSMELEYAYEALFEAIANGSSA